MVSVTGHWSATRRRPGADLLTPIYGALVAEQAESSPSVRVSVRKVLTIASHLTNSERERPIGYMLRTRMFFTFHFVHSFGHSLPFVSPLLSLIEHSSSTNWASFSFPFSPASSILRPYSGDGQAVGSAHQMETKCNHIK